MQQNEDEKAQKALDAVLCLQDYLDSECESVSEIRWKDKLGYTFCGDMGYIFEGLDAIEDYLLKRLRKGRIEEDERRRISGGCRHDNGKIEPFRIEYEKDDNTTES